MRQKPEALSPGVKWDDAKRRRMIVAVFIGCGCLSILLFIFIIFSAIGIPAFYRHVIVSKQDDARAVLTEIYKAELAYYDSHKTYTESFSDLGITAAPRTEAYEFGILSADEDGFVARAWGNLDGDPALDIWEITHRSPEPVHRFDDVREKHLTLP
jgi:hypothetical protein